MNCLQLQQGTGTIDTVPLVSVLMPVRDGAAFLTQAVHSILMQTLQDFELLAVDDGSRDATPAILAELARGDPRIRLLRHARLGLVPALNAGLHAARAPYVARMDADDVAYPERLAAQVAALISEPDVAVVGSACRVIGPNGTLRRILRPPMTAEAVDAALGRHNCIVHPTVMMRRQIVTACGGYRAAFLLAEDFDLWLRLREKHRLMNLDAVLMDYREHAGQSAWQDLQQRMLSEMGALAAAACRASGRDDRANGATAVDRTMLRELGMDDDAIRAGLLGRGLGSAIDALAAQRPRSCRAAIRIAWEQAGGPRTKAHLGLLWLRSLL